MKITPVKKKTIYKTGITQVELARQLGLRPQEVGFVLDGRRFTPHIQEAVAKYFGRTVEELFGRWAWTKVYKRRPAERRGLASGAGGGRVKSQRNGDTPPAPLGRGEITKKEGGDRDGQ